MCFLAFKVRPCAFEYHRHTNPFIYAWSLYMRYISGLHRWLSPVGIRLSRKLPFLIPDAMEHSEIIGSTLPSFLSMHLETENPNRIAIYFPACAQDVRGNVSPVAPLDYFKIRGLLNLPFYFIMLRVTLGPIALCKIEWTESTKSRYRLTSLEGSLRQSFWRSCALS